MRDKTVIGVIYFETNFNMIITVTFELRVITGMTRDIACVNARVVLQIPPRCSIPIEKLYS